jgi:N-acetyl-anhydromuramyl-L-alanine amidase AmpD
MSALAPILLRRRLRADRVRHRWRNVGLLAVAGAVAALASGCAHGSIRWHHPHIDAAEYPGATWIPAPSTNFAPAARTREDVRWIVIHTTEDKADVAIRRLTDPARRVSVHYLVRRDGSVVQFVRNEDVAYHAGNLAYNRASISIEHERYDGAEITPAQLRASRDLVRWLFRRYAIQPRIVVGLAPADPSAGSGLIGHDQVPDLRHSPRGGGENHHTDPVHWDWAAYRAALELSAADGLR